MVSSLSLTNFKINSNTAQLHYREGYAVKFPPNLITKDNCVVKFKLKKKKKTTTLWSKASRTYIRPIFSAD